MQLGEPRFIERDRWTDSMRVIPSHVMFMLICKACGMRRPILRNLLQEQAKPEDSLEKMERRLRCSSCGKKEGRIAVGFLTDEAGE